jgi:hypothetical protein
LARVKPLPRALVCLVVASCSTPRWAVVDGKRVERPTLGYTDNHHYSIQHRRAFPDVFAPSRALSVDDGRIVGRACGLELDFDASWYGPRVSLDGRFDVPWIRDFTRTEGLLKLALDITQPAAQRRRMSATVPFRIDLDVSPERLVGDIGPRHYELAADGRYLVGRMTGEVWRHGRAERVDEPLAIYGRQALATMQPADEAIVLLTMLSCSGVSLDRDGVRVSGFSLVSIE